MDSSRLGPRVASTGRLLIVSLLLSTLLFCWPGQPPRGAAAATVSPPDHAAALNRSALAFEPNAGQTDPAVRYLARRAGATLFFTSGEVVLALRDPGAALEPPAGPRSAGAVVRVRFEGANPAPEVTTVGRLPGVVNYLRGSDPARWHTNLPTYTAIQYKELYPGVALGYEGGGGSLKGTYTVAPGADPSLIRWRYEGVVSVRVDQESGDLQITPAKAGQPALIERAPAAWQTIGGRRVPVSAAYTIADDGTVGLAVGPYDRGRALTIDPELQYSTYLGGNNIDEGRAIAIDGEGNTYVAGWTNSTDFPTAGALQAGPLGYTDAFVVKLNAEGNTRVFATYLGGEWHDEANSIAVDNLGNILITGKTNSRDWPLAGAIQATLLNINGEGFLTKLTPMGSGLIFSTYLGGTGGAEARGVAAGADGNIYVTGSAGSGFPLVAPYEPRSRGGDAFVAKLDRAGARFVYSTYLGGSSLDDAYGIAVDRAGNAFVTGKTISADFPTANAYQAQCRPVPGYTNCTTDAFVSGLSADGSHLFYSTYLGSSGADEGFSIALDEEGKIAVTGMTAGTDFPVVNAAQPTYGGAQSDAFVTKLDGSSGQPVFSTYLGGNNVEYGTQEAVAVDAEGKIAVVGSTSSGNFPLVNPIIGALRPGNVNAFVTQYTPTGAITFSSYLGSASNTSGASGVALDAAGNAYVAGVTRADDFPTLNPAQPIFGGGVSDAFATKIHIGPGVALRFSPPELTFEKQESGTTSPTQAVLVTNVSSGAVSIASAALAGANPLDFAIVSDTCSAATLAASGTCEIAATFSPRASGMRYARIALDGPGWSRSVPLIGLGAPTAELTPGHLEFPLTKPNTKSESLTETLRNVGLEPLVLGAVTIAGTDPSQFSIESDGCTNATIEAGGTCDVVVSFVPTKIGQYFGQLAFASSVFDAPVTASLAGTGGTTPVLTVDRSEWGVCEGLVVRVHGANFPPSGQYQVSFDDTPLITGATGTDGSFSTLVTIPPATGGLHVISATDTVMTTYHAEAPVRTPGTDLPVIFIPGVSGSFLDATSTPSLYTAPPDPELAIPFPDPRQLLPGLYTISSFQHIWLDGEGVLNIFAGRYRFLDMVRLKPDGVTPQPDWLGITHNLQVGDVLWEVDAGVTRADFYGGLQTFLRNLRNDDGQLRYRYGDNLYYFPYDWRKDIALTGPDLDRLIDRALLTSEKDKVVLLAHSMGGLVSRNYLLQYGTSKVDQLITMGTPYLGSPLVAKVLEMGDDWSMGGHPFGQFGVGLHPAEAKKISQNFPASYELLPPPGFWSGNYWEPWPETYLIRQQRVYGSAKLEHQNYAQSIEFMSQRHNRQLIQQTEVFRQRGIGDFSLLRGQLFQQRIIGTNLDTIGGMIMSPRQVCTDSWLGIPWGSLLCIPLPEFAEVRWVSGDNAVPLRSGLGAGWQNDKGYGDDERTYMFPGVKHGELPLHTNVQNHVERMLRGKLCRTTNLPPLTSADGTGVPASGGLEAPAELPATPWNGVTGVQIVTAGTATLAATDGEGRLTGAIEGVPYAADYAIPGSNWSMTNGGQMIALTGDGSYTLKLRGMSPGGAAMLRIDTLQNGKVTESRIFESIPVTTTTAATVTLTLPGPVVGATLAFTTDAGSPVREAAQLPLLSGEAAGDLLPPVTQISVSPDRQVTLTATDTGGSGLRQIRYSTDGGTHYQAYTGPFPLTGCVTAVAADWAGNAEYPAAALPCADKYLYLPLVMR